MSSPPTNSDDQGQPSHRTVDGMPWIDSDGDTGFYTGTVNASNLPDGEGVMKYDEGPVVKSRWKEGEMVIEEEVTETKTEQRNPSYRPKSKHGSRGNSGSGGDSSMAKQLQLQQFHEQNQRFLQSTQGQYFQQQQQCQGGEVEHDFMRSIRKLFQEQQERQQRQLEQLQLQHEQQLYEQQLQQEQELQEHQQRLQQQRHEIHALREEVQQLRHDLRITRDTDLPNKDRSRAEINFLKDELDRQNSLHELVVSSLRNRLEEMSQDDSWWARL